MFQNMKNNDFLEKDLETEKEIKIYYNLLGFEAKNSKKFKPETLVFLHGLGGDLAAWDEIRELFLKKGFRSVAVDLRGHGLSSRPEKNRFYSFDELAEDVLKIIRQEELSQVILVGHCLGGMIAQQIAITNPEEVLKLVLISTSCQPFRLIKKLKINAAISKLAQMFENYLSKVHASGRISHRKFVGSGDFNVFRIMNDLKYTSLNSYSQIFSKVHNFDLSKKITNIKAETLIIVGNKDSIFPVNSSKRIDKLIPKTKYIQLDKADHMIIFKYPKEVVNSVADFI